MCSSQNRRVSISFFRVRSLRRAEAESSFESMNVWQQGLTAPYTTQDSYETFDGIPKCGFLQSPVVMLAPVSPMAISPGGAPRGGTGVFLPWSVGLPKPAKHLPPRAQRQRFLPLPSTLDTQSWGLVLWFCSPRDFLIWILLLLIYFKEAIFQLGMSWCFVRFFSASIQIGLNYKFWISHSWSWSWGLE